MFKGSDQWETRGGGSGSWQMIRIGLGLVVLDVLFAFNLVTILDYFISLSAHSSPMSCHQPVIRFGAANMTLPLTLY
jgi:hypothetical protein